jgi:hypothetical protein
VGVEQRDCCVDGVSFVIAPGGFQTPAIKRERRWMNCRRGRRNAGALRWQQM